MSASLSAAELLEMLRGHVQSDDVAQSGVVSDEVRQYDCLHRHHHHYHYRLQCSVLTLRRTWNGHTHTHTTRRSQLLNPSLSPLLSWTNLSLSHTHTHTHRHTLVLLGRTLLGDNSEPPYPKTSF